MTPNQFRAYLKFVSTWNDCTHFGTINSRVDRINDVYVHLVKLGVTDLIPYLLISEKTQAFVYEADLGFVSEANLDRKLTHVVEIYQDLRPHATEWRVRNAQIALRLDADLVAGLDEGVAIPEFVIPFAQTAQEEALLSN